MTLLGFVMECCSYEHCSGSWWNTARMDTVGVCDGMLLVWTLLWFVMVCCSYGHSLLGFMMVCCSYEHCWGSWWYAARVNIVDSAHSKLHEMYSQGNPLPKSIQTISSNWVHMFRNQLQQIQFILQPVKLKSVSKGKIFQRIGRQCMWISVLI